MNLAIGEDGNFFFFRYPYLTLFYEKYLNYYKLSYQCLQDKLSPLFIFIGLTLAICY